MKLFRFTGFFGSRILALCNLVGMIVIVCSTAHAQESKRKIIVDDDGFTLSQLMLLSADDVDVLGITTVSGDAWANRVTAYALRGIELAGRTDVPVVQGAIYPLLNSEALTDRWEALYGKLAWKGAWMRRWVEPTQQSAPVFFGANDPVVLSWGNPTTRASYETAASFLIRMVRTYPGEVTILATGPMTNLALAQRLDPGFASLAKELVYMGGSLNPRQMLDNRSADEFAREYNNNPRREFNARFDPEAASIVSRSPWRKITIVPVDPSTSTQLGKKLMDIIAQGSSPGIAKFLAHVEPGFPLWDQIAAGVWLDPTIVTDKETLFVDYNTQFSASYGDMLSWRAGYQPGVGERPAEVIRSVDVARLEALMVRVLANNARKSRKE